MTKFLVIAWLLLSVLSLGVTAFGTEQRLRIGNAVSTLAYLLCALGAYLRR